jgi:hypothetical protein
MPQPPEVEAAAEELIRLYRDAWERILAEQDRIATEPNRARRRARLRELRGTVEAELAALDAPTRLWLATRLPEVYRLGSGSSWSQFHRSAVQQIATDTFGDVLAATRYVRADVKRMIRELGKAVSERVVITDTAQGGARTLRNLLRERGLAAITYKNGARHGLGDYTDMLVRTKSAVAYSTGTINAAAEQGYEALIIFDGPGCGLTGHNVGPEANGMIVSLDEARAFPLSHPRCQRGFSALPGVARPQRRAIQQPAPPIELRPRRIVRRPREPRRAASA